MRGTEAGPDPIRCFGANLFVHGSASSLIQFVLSSFYTYSESSLGIFETFRVFPHIRILQLRFLPNIDKTLKAFCCVTYSEAINRSRAVRKLST